MSEGRIQGTVLGVVVRRYESGQFRELAKATEQLNELCTLLEGYGYAPTVVEDPSRGSLRGSVEGWRKGWEEGGAHGPAIVVWSGHGVLDGDRDLRLVMHDTHDTEDEEQTYSARLLTNAALRSRADQVLMLIDICYSGAGVVESLQQALSAWSVRSLPQGQATWLGVVASCRPQEEAQGRGVLLDALADVLRNGPRTQSYQHEWSPRNWRVTGAAVLRAVLDQWPDDQWQRPIVASVGMDLPMFRNPHVADQGEPALVEHLVRAASGAGREEKGWFFTGRRRVLGEIVGWLAAGEPGLFLVTGSAGSGKSAVLGRVATLSDPRHRADIVEHAALCEGDPDPGEGSVDVPLHLRGLNVQQLAEAIARRLHLDAPRTPAALIADVEMEWPPSGQPPVLLLDGLDEAASGQAAPIVEQLLSPLSRMTRVLLASRDRPFTPQAEEVGEPLDKAVSRLLGIRARAVSLDDEVDTGDDIKEYARRRLLAAGLSYGAADLISQRASVDHGGFLFAQMAVDSAIRHIPEADTDGWETSIPASISAAFIEDLATGSQLEHNGKILPLAAQELLTALAWGAGNGIPARGVWEAVSTALSTSGTVYDREDLDWLLNSYGRYIVEDSDGVQAVYRLYHRELIQRLRDLSREQRKAGQPEPAYLVARTLVDLLRQQSDDASVLEKANPYLRTSLAEHVARAGGRGITLVRELVELREEALQPDLARALGALAQLLSVDGLREAALTPSQEAADLYRTLADINPAAYLPDLAASLNNLAVYQNETGDRLGALTTINEAVTIRRTLAQTNPTAYLPDLAASLNNLAVYQNETGDRHGALTTINEAVTIRRTLAQTNPTAYLPDLAASLNNLAVYQNETGDRLGALTTINEAVTIRRTLAQTNPTAYLPDLAASLNNLAIHQNQTGDRHGALTTINEAVTIRRTLAQTNPTAYLPDLAASLNNLAIHQNQTGDRHGALTTITEAVTIRRTLAQANPTAHLPNVAMALNNLATSQSETGDQEAALATITEATHLYRTLAQTNPAAYLPDLAASLNNLATSQSETGDQEAALATITEATHLYRTLAQTNPAAYLPDLSMSLNNLAVYQNQTGDRQGALATITEAVTIRRTLAQTNPAAYLPDLAATLNNLATSQSETGDQEAALATITEATHLYRTLAQTNPAAYLPDLSMSLNNLAVYQNQTGDRQGALATITEAVTIRRTLAQTNPAAYLPDLATSLNNLATSQSETGDQEAALATITEAVTIRRTLAQTNPAAYLPDLATSLNNLATSQSETGDQEAALATITEAVTIRRDLAQANPAVYLTDLAASLDHLATVTPPQLAITAYTEAENSLAVHPVAARQIAVQQAKFQLRHADANAGIRTLTGLLQSPPHTGPDPAALQARRLLRDLSRSNASVAAQFGSSWRASSGTEPPAWLRLPETSFDLAIEWINCPTWVASRSFWEQHASRLQSPETTLALEELALAYESAEHHLHLVRDAVTENPDSAFRPYITQELLSTWIDCPTWEESQTYLSDHAEDLLHDHAHELLNADSESAEAAVHFALLLLAQADGIAAAYEYIADRATLNERIQGLLAAPDATLLDACARLELLVHQDEFTATVHLAIAAILAETTYDPAHWPAPDPADRDRAAIEIAILLARSPQHAPALTSLLKRLFPGETP
ncbi:tetratricopeptide repeat protein [Streptomyces sp. NBC_00124]|uniref:tetratricopeptide repeat protein n=1 Tax=Streptomyces sp. NBC_00124 TaxID=2975662 RepID=UPI0022507681|nr:tetratricopeptide repeat protein [Streptomyces sp. NBC_00124]MCX5364184.1 tetratricopeptide repeat protein [Streptomyces sp. NBC_00124]